MKCRNPECPVTFPDVPTGGRRREYCTRECRNACKLVMEKRKRKAKEILRRRHWQEYETILGEIK